MRLLLALALLPITACAQQTAAMAPDASSADGGTRWIFHKGKFLGGGDWSYGSGSVNYSHSDPEGLSGKKVIAVTGDEGLQPYFAYEDFDTSGYNYVTVAIKPTQEGNTWITGAEMKGDTPIPGAGPPPSIMQYGPNPAVVGQWNVYKIPLSAYGIKPGMHILKIMFQETSSPSKSTNEWYVDSFGFVP
jgi:hypothetical protein